MLSSVLTIGSILGVIILGVYLYGQRKGKDKVEGKILKENLQATKNMREVENETSNKSDDDLKSDLSRFVRPKR